MITSSSAPGSALLLSLGIALSTACARPPDAVQPLPSREGARALVSSAPPPEVTIPIQAPSAVPSAVAPAAVAPSAAPSAVAPPLVAARTLRYRELFTGSLPFHAQIQTWTLILGEHGRFRLTIERAEAPENSLIAGKARPLGPLTILSHDDHEGSFISHAHGAIDLQFDDAARPAVGCRPARVQALEAGAELSLKPIPGANSNSAKWKPSTRRSIDVLGCERSWLATAPTWSGEPQPERLPLADLPGVEYAHDNDDMVVQQGGVRRLEP